MLTYKYRYITSYFVVGEIYEITKQAKKKR